MKAPLQTWPRQQTNPNSKNVVSVHGPPARSILRRRRHLACLPLTRGREWRCWGFDGQRLRVPDAPYSERIAKGVCSAAAWTALAGYERQAKKTVDDLLPEEGSATVASDRGVIGCVSSQSSFMVFVGMVRTSSTNITTPHSTWFPQAGGSHRTEEKPGSDGWSRPHLRSEQMEKKAHPQRSGLMLIEV